MTTHIYIDTPKWTYRTHSTDTAYARSILPRLAERSSSLEITGQESDTAALLDNARSAGTAALRRLQGRRHSRSWTKKLALWDSGLRKSQVVYSNFSFPVNSPLPVIWQNTLVDPQMRLAHGDAARDIEYELAKKTPLFQAASAIIVSTHAERIRLQKAIPSSHGKIHAIPFFLPGIVGASPDILQKHDAPPLVKILFVGNPARLKRLPMLLDALELLPAALRQRLELTVISHFTDGVIPIQCSFPVRVLGGLPHSQVQEEMRQAHILVNPSSYETFGFVFLEAQAAGTVAVGPSWEAQREIFEAGRCGVLLPVEATANDLSSVLAKLLHSDELRRRLATAALARYRSTYASDVVASRLIDLILTVTKT